MWPYSQQYLQYGTPMMMPSLGTRAYQTPLQTHFEYPPAMFTSGTPVAPASEAAWRWDVKVPPHLVQATVIPPEAATATPVASTKWNYAPLPVFDSAKKPPSRRRIVKSLRRALSILDRLLSIEEKTEIVLPYDETCSTCRKQKELREMIAKVLTSTTCIGGCNRPNDDSPSSPPRQVSTSASPERRTSDSTIMLTSSGSSSSQLQQSRPSAGVTPSSEEESTPSPKLVGRRVPQDDGQYH